MHDPPNLGFHISPSTLIREDKGWLVEHNSIVRTQFRMTNMERHISGFGEQRPQVHLQASLAQRVRTRQVPASGLHLPGRSQLRNLVHTLEDRHTQL